MPGKQVTRFFFCFDEARESPARMKPGAKMLTPEAFKVLPRVSHPTRNKHVETILMPVTRQPNSHNGTKLPSNPASNLHRIQNGQKLPLEQSSAGMDVWSPHCSAPPRPLTNKVCVGYIRRPLARGSPSEKNGDLTGDRLWI